MPRAAHLEPNVVRLKRLRIDTYQEPVIFMARDCPVCRSEGWTSQQRVDVTLDHHSIIATLNVVDGSLLAPDEASLSEVAWLHLNARDGDLVRLADPPTTESLSYVRAKVYGHHLGDAEIDAIVHDIALGLYSDIELAAFVTAFAGSHVELGETIALTRSMVSSGERLYWGRTPVVDKHCVGGLPGNRTSMIVVPIAAAAGLLMPKTSSRAITSPAGTADAMETVAPVDLELAAMRRVVEREGACIVWGGTVELSPADDVIISVERPLGLDSPPQLAASVLSKKIAAGSTHVVIDMPVGPTAKVRSTEAADSLASLLTAVANATGLVLDIVRTDGTQPVGRGIGPALEARDVLSVLRTEPNAPADLRDRAVDLAGHVLEIGGATAAGSGRAMAADVLASGRALAKFEAICAAQGGMRAPPRAPLNHVVRASRHGRIVAIDNRRVARIARLAGAPRAPASGVELHARLGQLVDADEPLFTIHAEAPGELQYAQTYLAANPQVITLEEA